MPDPRPAPRSTLGALTDAPRWWLPAGLFAGLLLQAVFIAREWSTNPFARVPVNDAAVYWSWAGDLAHGRFVGGAPYFSAPLYPWFVGVVRAFGGGLLVLYALQALAHLATAALLFRVARLRGGPWAGLVALVLWILLGDAGGSTARVLNGGITCLAVAWLFERALVLERASSTRNALLFGLATGIATLANPVLLLIVPVLAAWSAWIAPAASRMRHAACTGLVALLAVSPATLHNALACGEFIPIAAQAGVTFLHGNSPGADGTYQPIPGVSADRGAQNAGARALVRAETDGSWNATSSALFRRGFAWWSAEPEDAMALAARKLWWFMTGRRYGDIYLPELEQRDGWSIALRIAPLPAAWLALPALAALAFLARDPRRHLPELVLFLVPLATVVVFWYSPRYRLPAMPIACVLVACAFAGPATRRTRIACALVTVFAIATGPLNRMWSFDTLANAAAPYAFQAGKVLAEDDRRAEAPRLAEAADRYREAARLGHPEAASALGDVLRRLGRPDDALVLLRDNVLRQPESVFARRSLAVALAQANELVLARTEFEAALKLDPNDAESLAGLGGVLYQGGDVTGAMVKLRAALELRPGLDSAHYNLAVALEAGGDLEEAEFQYHAALQSNPKLARAAHAITILRVGAGDFRGALEEVDFGLRHSPADPSLGSTAAWLLATAPDAALRDGRKALALIEPLRRAAPHDPGLWNIRAAALAECGRFGEAVEAAQRSWELLGQAGMSDAQKEIQERLDLYRRGLPFHQKGR